MKTANPVLYFEQQALGNKWLNQLTETERQHIINMLDDYHSQFTKSSDLPPQPEKGAKIVDTENNIRDKAIEIALKAFAEDIEEDKGIATQMSINRYRENMEWAIDALISAGYITGFRPSLSIGRKELIEAMKGKPTGKCWHCSAEIGIHQSGTHHCPKNGKEETREDVKQEWQLCTFEDSGYLYTDEEKLDAILSILQSVEKPSISKDKLVEAIGELIVKYRDEHAKAMKDENYPYPSLSELVSAILEITLDLISNRINKL